MTTGVTDPFAYHAPSTARDAADLLSNYRGNAKLLAGGHSLIPMMKLRLTSAEGLQALIDLKNVDGIKGITENEDGSIHIGAMTTYHELITSDVVNAQLPALAEAASQVADTQVRNWGTIGGSLAHADPAADIPAVAVALDATIHSESERATKNTEIKTFFKGYLETSLRHNDVLTGLTFAAPAPGTGSAYVKLGNKASHYAIVGVCAAVTIDDEGVCSDARIGVTGAGPNALRSRRAEKLLVGKALDDGAISRASMRSGAELADRFNDDVHASAEYRAAMTQVYTERALTVAVERASG